MKKERAYVGKTFLGLSKRKRNWGRSMRVDTWDKLELVIELIKTDLPIDLKIALKDAGVLSPAPPLPYDPTLNRPELQCLSQCWPRCEYRSVSTKRLHGCYQYSSASTSYSRQKK
jgi:hypothetical protein